MADLVFHVTAERPDLKFWLLDDDGELIDFSTGYSYTFKIGTLGSAAVFTKTSGITGSAGSGTEPTGEPNILMTFVAGELAAVPPRSYRWQLVATSSSLDRVFQGRIEIRNVIT
jgi:hypothetical protein